MRRIPRSFIYAAALLFPLAALAVGAPNQKQPFTLTLAAPKEPLKAGQPLILSVTVTNTSDGPVGIPLSGGSPDVGKVYQVHICDERGQVAPRAPLPKPRGKGFVIVAGGSILTKQLKRDGTLTDRVNVTELYDLSRPGKYKIWIAEPYYRGPHVPNGLAKSNIITVTVTK